MKRNMKQWVADTIAAPTKQAVPVLSFPAVQLMDITVRDLISSSEYQAKGMKMVADKVASGASVSLMDLSVEAECFGSEIRVSDDEVPTVVGAIVTDEDEADALAVPAVGVCRTGIYIDAIAKASEMITDRPVFAGVIGPFSLAGRLMDVGEAMAYCYEEPDMVHTVLEKTTAFLIEYCNAYKAAGANGVVMAEPLAGMLSPNLAEEFSHPYVKKIVDAVQSDEFALIYHNCGDNVALMSDAIYGIGAMGYHFGNACRLADMIPSAPADVLVMGNVDPAGQINQGTPESVREATLQVMKECCHAPNFVISSGCDIPPMSPWANIEAFFAAAEEFYR
ncbi:MAG: uroporphyrinogen decarboxylase family protein [Oscillospiraceae bacterium]|nr:uroporphyrinogen decarboxylase family protein [Oscillospiraceae bacterium]